MSKDTLVCFIVFVLSIGVGQFYTEGDQMHYIAAYKAIENSDLLNGFLIYKSHITTEEPVHFFISWLFSSVVNFNKIFAMSISNSLLAYLLIQFVRKIGGSPLLAYSIVLSNYYFFVLYLTAERLKFSFIFFLAAMLVMNRSKIFYILFAFSFLSHLQMLIIYVARQFELYLISVLRLFNNYSIKKSFLSNIIILFVLIIILSYLLGDYLLWKIPQYMGSSSLSSIWQSILFMMMSFVYAKNRVRVVLFFIPIIFASFVVGPERITIIAYFVFIYHAFQYKRGMNFGLGITVLYFGIKSIGFIVNVFNTGQGFSESILD